MTDLQLAAKLVDTLYRPDGSRALRPVHSFGDGATGHFAPSKDAARFCTAEMFTAPSTPVTVRFSNGSGAAVRRDGWSDVRGMATRFHLSNDWQADLVAMTLREFFAPTPESFLDFAVEARPAPFKKEPWWRKLLDYLSLLQPIRDAYPGETIRPDEGAMAFADAHASAQLGVMEAATIGAPVSYARAAYHAVHTFVVTGAEGERHHVRFTWQPTLGVLNTDPFKPPEDDYLADEFNKRLERGPVGFMLMMALGEVGDDYADCTRAWPPHRRRVFMGTLTLDTPIDAATNEKLSFNPWFAAPGIEPSADPVLDIRREVYAHSGRARGAHVCPFAPPVKAQEDAA